MGGFKPSHSLIALLDSSSFESEKLSALIEELTKSYSLQALSDAVGRMGSFALAFTHPRKLWVREFLPVLIEKKVSCTVFVLADCVGTNRLPPEDDLAAYHQEFPTIFTQTICDELLKLSWESPAGYLERFEKKRKEAIRPPIAAWKPENFMTTWGALSRLPPFIEVGLFADNSDLELLRKAKTTIEKLSGKVISAALVLQGEKGLDLQDLGIQSVVIGRRGVVHLKTDRMALPHWVAEEETNESEEGKKENHSAP